MEEPVGARYAVQIAVQTLKERCKSLQQRVSHLEEENLSLRVNNVRDGAQNIPLSEIEQLRAQVLELSEQKHHLLNKVRMVKTENQDLWTKLSRLTQVNQTLGNHLDKINDSLEQYATKNKEAHSPLIRSKTFTQDEPQTKVLQKNIEENNKICSELEEISLKIINSITQGKHELDSLYSDIADGINSGENVINDSCGFYYDDLDNNIFDDVTTLFEELKVSKQIVVAQKEALKIALNKIVVLQDANKKSSCDKLPKKYAMVDKSTSTLGNDLKPSPVKQSSISNNLPDKSSQEESDQICPMCCKNFYDIDFKDFVLHVETHLSDQMS